MRYMYAEIGMNDESTSLCFFRFYTRKQKDALETNCLLFVKVPSDLKLINNYLGKYYDTYDRRPLNSTEYEVLIRVNGEFVPLENSKNIKINDIIELIRKNHYIRCPDGFKKEEWKE